MGATEKSRPVMVRSRLRPGPGVGRGVAAAAARASSAAATVATRARIHPYLVEAGHFGVSILARDQEKLSLHFSGRPVTDLEPEFVRIGRTPLLAEACATIAADVVAHHACGDHSMFVGHILHMQAFARAPLIVHEGHYAHLTYSQQRAPEWVTDFW